MSSEKPIHVVRLLSRALHRIRTTSPRLISSPATQPRRAAVALVIRVLPSPHSPPIPSDAPIPTLSQFFELDWVNDPNASVEILYLHRDGAAPSDGVPGSYASASSTSSTSSGAKAEAHIAFPGGRMEEGDEGGLYTAMRQTWEEIGLDLAERDFTCIGQLDDREITTSLGKRLLMILSPFVFLQLTANPIPVDPAEGTEIYWTPLDSLVDAVSPVPAGTDREHSAKWTTVNVDAASRITPKHAPKLKHLVRLLLGTMQFPALLLDVPDHTVETVSAPSYPSPVNSPPLKGPGSFPTSTQDSLEKGVPSALKPKYLKLWGLSLGMTLDLLSNMIPSVHSTSVPSLPSPPPSVSSFQREQRSAAAVDSSVWLSALHLPFRPVGGEGMRVEAIAPSLASVFPRFSYPDVNFWIWVFGKRYREVVRGWEASMRSGGSNDRRINWAGTALNTFYAAVRKALIVVIILRAIGIIIGLAFAAWWVFS